jgi:hypothetical protein
MATSMSDVVVKLLQRRLKDAENSLKMGKDNNAPNIPALEKAVEEAKKAVAKYDAATGSARTRLTNKYLNEYYDRVGDWVRDLVKQFPQLTQLFSKAISQGWNDTRFRSELYKSDWWKEQKSKGRGNVWLEAFILENDPAQQGAWITKIDEVKRLIQDMADSMFNMRLDDVDLDKIARRFVYQGWDASDNRGLRVWLSRQFNKQQGAVGDDDDPGDVDDPRPTGGTFAELERGFRDALRAYGIERGSGWAAEMAQAVLDPESGITEDDVWNELIREAESMYPVFSGRVSRDRSVRDLAEGYVRTISNLLELDYEDVNLSDPLLQRAFTNLDKDNNPMLMPLWEFKKQARQDDRWQYTDNARDTYMSAASKFSRALGLAG